MRRTVELHRPSLLAGSVCVGLGLANWVAPSLLLVAVCCLVTLGGLAFLGDEGGRTAALAIALVLVGLWWGSLRLDAMRESALVEEIGSSATAELVVTGPARLTPWVVRVPAEITELGGARLRERVLLVLPVGRSPPRGAVLEAVVRVTEPRAGDGGFDERAWLARQGVHVVLRASTWRQVGRRGGLPGVGDRLRDRIELAVSRGADGVRRALVLGVVLGEDEGLPERVRQDFRASGLAHLLAVSGQNVAFIAGGVTGLCWLLRVPRVARELVIVAAVLVYVLSVGWQPSVVRAGVAGMLASLAWLVARPRDRWHFLALGALVLLAWTPASLLEPGFQLSFAAVAAIFLGLSRARRVLEGYPVPRLVIDPFGLAVVCGLATAPFVLLHFDRAPVYTVPANLLAFAALPAVLALGLLAALVDPFAPGVAAVLAWGAGWTAAWIEVVAQFFASLPGAQVGARGALVTVVLAVAAVLGARRLRAKPNVGDGMLSLAAAGLVLVVVAGWWWTRPAPDWERPAGLRVTFLDVGQGDAALLETPSARVLVDQGPPEANVAGQLVGMGVRSLSALVLTHPERDHVGGAAAVLRRLHVGAVLDPALEATGPEHEEALAAAAERHVPVRLVRAGSELRTGGLVLRALWPADGGLASENPNLNAVVLVASYGETDVLLPADAESDVTARLPLGEIEVLKVAHHGSEDPGLGDELSTLRPRIAVISCGRGNEYGHPRTETLAALRSVPEVAVYRTDEDGRVVVESDGRRLRVRTGQ